MTYDVRHGKSSLQIQTNQNEWMEQKKIVRWQNCEKANYLLFFNFESFSGNNCAHATSARTPQILILFLFLFLLPNPINSCQKKKKKSSDGRVSRTND